MSTHRADRVGKCAEIHLVTWKTFCRTARISATSSRLSKIFSATIRIRKPITCQSVSYEFNQPSVVAKVVGNCKTATIQTQNKKNVVGPDGFEPSTSTLSE